MLFRSKHMAKDVRLMKLQAQALELELPVTNAIQQLFARSELMGLSEQDYSAILEFLDKASPVVPA